MNRNARRAATLFAAMIACWMFPSHTTLAAMEDVPAVGTASSKVYHITQCVHCEKISPERRVTFATENDAIVAGRRICKTCDKLRATNKAPRLSIDGQSPAKPEPQSTAKPEGDSSRPSSPRGETESAAAKPASSQPASAPALDAKVVRVIEVTDGDSLKLDSGDRIRLIGLSCPGAKQSFGREARRFVEERAYWRRVEISFDPANVSRSHRDRYKRLIGYVNLSEGGDLGEMLLREGLAWVETEYPCAMRPHYVTVQDEARAALRGIWKPLSGLDGEQQVSTTSRSHTYHPVDCTHLSRSNDRTTLTINEAKKRGLSPCSNAK